MLLESSIHPPAEVHKDIGVVDFLAVPIFGREADQFVAHLLHVAAVQEEAMTPWCGVVSTATLTPILSPPTQEHRDRSPETMTYQPLTSKRYPEPCELQSTT